MAELRELARGIHPAILTDRGLGPAIKSLADRADGAGGRPSCAVDRELPAPIEAAAYFLVAEALTNVARYAEASRARVSSCGSTDGELVVLVADDGVGGVDPAAGSGLRGLDDRVAAVGGRLEIDSPHGGGTTAAGEAAAVKRALLLALLLLAGCGKATVVREAPVHVAGTPSGTPVPGAPEADGAVRIAVVTHGPASSKFWAIIRNGVDAAARRLDVLVDYRSPDVYSLERMSALIDRAVATKPDGLVVSIPEPGLAPAIKRAVAAGIPVVSINSGSADFKSLGVLAHVGQVEDRAGLEAGRRLAQAGVRRALCLNQQVGNTGLDARCAGLAKAMREVGGSSRVLPIVDDSPATPGKIARAVAAGRADGVLATNSLGGLAAAQVLGGRQDRHLRPHPRRHQGGPRGEDRLRGRPAALPAGLPADRDARAARPLRDLPGPGRRGRHWAAFRHPRATPRRRSS